MSGDDIIYVVRVFNPRRNEPAQPKYIYEVVLLQGVGEAIKLAELCRRAQNFYGSFDTRGAALECAHDADKYEHTEYGVRELQYEAEWIDRIDQI